MKAVKFHPSLLLIILFIVIISLLAMSRMENYYKGYYSQESEERIISKLYQLLQKQVGGNRPTLKTLRSELRQSLNQPEETARNESLNTKNVDEYYQKLHRHGYESIDLHDFKSPYIVDPRFYDSVPKAPGIRSTKIMSCYNCPEWFVYDRSVNYSQNFDNCPYSECLFDGVGARLQDADVVLFFPKPKAKPPRPPGQIWAYGSLESPVHFDYPSPYSQWRDVFNWSYGYRLDADLFVPYDFLMWRANDTLMPDSWYYDVAAAKKKTAAWLVSHCKTPSLRMKYVKEMQKHIDIDIFGKCTSVECNNWTCLKTFNKTYKFYLSFENSLCKDYVTEKFFRNFRQRLQIIPVVRGAVDYQKHFPPNAFVDASKFKSPKDLAQYLSALGKDIPRYATMLKEKDKLTTLGTKFHWCDWCKKLHTDTKSKIYRDIKQWSHQGACRH